MKILLNDNPTVTASALGKYILAADLSAQVSAVPAQAMLAAVRDEKPDMVMWYDENTGGKEVPDLFRDVKAYNPDIYRVLITGGKKLQSLSEELRGLADEIISYPFVTQELIMRLQRMFGSILPAGLTGAIPNGIQTDAPLPATGAEDAFTVAAAAPEVIKAITPEQPTAPAETEQPLVILPAYAPAEQIAATQQAEELTYIEEPVTEGTATNEPLVKETENDLFAVDETSGDPAIYPGDLQQDGVEKPQTTPAPQKKKSTLKKITAALSKAVVAVLVLLVAGMAVLLLTSKMNDGTPTVFGYRFYNVLTGSMEGRFKDSFDTGSLILVKPVKPADIKTNDVITFDRQSSDSKLTTHRVIAVNDDGNGNLSFTTKGDANPSQDSVPVPANIVKGKVIWHAAGVGNVIRFAQTDIGMIFTVFIPAGAIVIYEIYIFYLEHAEKKKKKQEAGAIEKDQ